MGKYGVLLVLVGLAVGLWLGFNPAAHRAVQRTWDQVSHARLSNSRSPLVVNVPLLRSSARVQTAPAHEQNNSPLGKQVSTDFHALVSALQQLWLQLLAKLKTIRL